MAELTTKGLRARWPGRDAWLTDGGARGAGKLIARLMRDGVAFYFQYFDGAGKKHRLPLGPYDETGENGLSLKAARDRAVELAELRRSGVNNLHDHIQGEARAAERARRAEEEAERRRLEESRRGTLQQLLDAYTDHLERNGKVSAGEAKGILTKHVIEEHSALIARKAAELSPDDFVPVIGSLVDDGKGRQAAKLRSYLRAAYSLAIASRTDPAAPMKLRTFGVTTNPVAAIGALARYNRARDRVLTAPELGAYLRQLDALPEGAQRDALLLTVYLGGQRPTQLLRTKLSDVDLDAATITLYDGKGRRQQARRHVLPLTKEALAILERRTEGLPADAAVFSTAPADSNERPAMRIETLSVLVTEIAGKMVKADPPEARESFQLRDIRRTCETMLASLKVSSDVRAQLQSHGLGGIQQRHYDKHSYALEKKQALEKWARHLANVKAGKTATVTPIKPRTTKGAKELAR